MMALRLKPFCISVTPSTLGRKGDGRLEMNMKRESRQGQQIPDWVLATAFNLTLFVLLLFR
jgi:hypothetical protein